MYRTKLASHNNYYELKMVSVSLIPFFSGPQFKKYEDYEMLITPNEEGAHVPPILVSGWEDLNPPSILLHNIRKLKMENPTPIQRCACNVIKHKYDCIAIAETGQGKTAVFLVPVRG